jgi:alpha-1,3-rhamnosyl/mannosyltransferase
VTSIVFDCRWLGRGGTGSVVSLLVRGLTDLHAAGAGPPFDVVLWGPAPAIAPLAWPGAEIVDDRHDPHQWAGQRGGWRRPTADLFCAMHQIRPLVAAPTLQLLHDTIPLHVARSRPERMAKRAYFLAVARRATFIVAGSEYSRGCIHEELGIPKERIGRIHYAVDPAFAARVAALRKEHADRGRERDGPMLLYVGRFARHKNIDRLVESFARSAAAANGARLVVAGGAPAEVSTIRDLVNRLGRDRLPVGGIDVLGSQSSDEIDRLFATTDAVIMPSIEEGFGLPAWEARAIGVAVAASSVGALTESAGPAARRFDPASVPEMSDAIDDVLLRGGGLGPVITGPTPAEFAREYAGFVTRVLDGRKRP